MQIMIMLTREKARPEIPDMSNLPGVQWSGAEGFVNIMQVRLCMGLRPILLHHIATHDIWLSQHNMQSLTVMPASRLHALEVPTVNTHSQSAVTSHSAHCEVS